jgi:adenylylsulfate kinase-like enzyme
MVIWVAGLSGAGKSTVCGLLYDKLKPSMGELVLLDGDGVREAFGNDLGHAEADRVKQVSRVQRLARLLASQDLVVLVAVVYSHPDLLRWNRENIPDYFEVLIDASLDVVRSRDTKGLYARALRGECENLVGYDIPWHRPVAANLVLNPDDGSSPLDMASAIARSIPRLAAVWPSLSHA